MSIIQPLRKDLRMINKKALTIIGLLVVVGIIGGVAYYIITLPEEEVPPPVISKPANFTVTVTDVNGTAIEDAKVTFLYGGIASPSKFTDSNGNASKNFDFLMPVNCTITVEKKPYDIETETLEITEAKKYHVNFVLSLSGTLVYLDPSEIELTVSEAPVGYRFNVTCWVHNITDLFAYQVTLHYDSSVINMTRASLPADHVLAGQTGIPTGPSYYYFDSWGRCVIGFSGFTGLATSFDGTGKLAVFEFEVVEHPPTGGNLTSELIISYMQNPGEWETKLRNSEGTPIGFSAVDGSYKITS
jgi:hypothetical protein